MSRYSYSKISTFQTCPLQYKFKYIDRIKVDVGPTIEAFMGSRVHEALEWLYDRVRNARVPTVDEVLAFYAERWDAEWSNDVRVIKEGFTSADYQLVGQKCLQMYCARHQPYDEGVILGLEEPFLVSLSESVTLTGFIDRLMKTGDGVYEVHDYKTSQRLPSLEQAQADEQGSWYALAVRVRFPHASEVRLVWHYLRHDEQLVTTRAAEQLSELRRDIAREIDVIESTTVFSPAESPLCSWCDYFQICPAKVHQLAVSELTKNEYMDEPGVVLVNRLAELKADLKEASAEIEKVEEALLHYAQENGYSVVVGDEMEAVIDIREAITLPTKSMPERESLDETVRQIGLWDEFSDLSTNRLSKALHEGTLPDEKRAKLEHFAKREKRRSIRLRRRSA